MGGERRMCCVGIRGRGPLRLRSGQVRATLAFRSSPNPALSLQKRRDEDGAPWYHDPFIPKWDIFHYIYAVLHHPEYRERYAANLRRELPRIPFASATTPHSCHSEPLQPVRNLLSPPPAADLPPVGMTTFPLCPLCPLW